MDEEVEQKTGSSLRWLWWLLALALLGGGFWYFKASKETTLSLREQVVPVRVAQAVLEEIASTIRAVATAKADLGVTIESTVTAHVEEVLFQNSMRVNEGQVIVLLKRDEEQARYDEALKQFERTATLAEEQYATQTLLDQRLAELEVARSNLTDRVIRAPFTGILGFVKIDPGALVKPGTVITTLVKIDPVGVQFEIPEMFLDHIALGIPFEATSIAYPGEIFEGVLTAIRPSIDPITRSVGVKGKIDNPDERLRPGMLINIALLSRPRKAVLVPEKAIAPLRNNFYVFVLQEDDTVRRQQVSIGQRDPGVVEILRGLQGGEWVVTEGIQRLKDGSRVRVLQAEEPLEEL